MPTFWNQFGNNYDQVNQNTGGMADYVRGLKSYLAPQQAPVPAPAQEPIEPVPAEPHGYGPAGLAGLGLLPGAAGAVVGGGLAAGAAALPLAAAYGIGKLVAPDRVDAAVAKVRDFLINNPLVKK